MRMIVLGNFYGIFYAPTLRYSAELHGEIADDIVCNRQAMKWGFGWQQGPFEIWDAIGVEESVEKMKAEGQEIPAFVQILLDKGFELSIKKKMVIYISSTERIYKSFL